MNWGFGSPGFLATVSGMAALFLVALGVFRWRRWL
jgi:hypothetical protein